MNTTDIADREVQKHYETRLTALYEQPVSPCEWIVAAAIKVRDVVCLVPAPGRHADVFYALARAGFDQRIGPETQGFVTSAGRFVGREEARKIAAKRNQLIKGDKSPDGTPFVREHSQLFSEDVW